MRYEIRYSKNVLKDIPKIKQAKLNVKLKKLLEIIRENPFQNPPPFEQLLGDLKGYYSRRINIKHKLVYKILEPKKQIQIVSIWSHYENI